MRLGIQFGVTIFKDIKNINPSVQTRPPSDFGLAIAKTKLYRSESGVDVLM